MAAPQKKPATTAVIVIRPSNTIALPPGPLGFNNLLEPESFADGPLKFKLNHHLSPEAIDATVETLQANAYSASNLKKLQEEFVEKKVKDAPEPRDVREWLSGLLREPKEGAADWARFPHITIGTQAEYKDRKSGEIKLRSIACWDAKNKKLDLKKLRLGRGSIIQPVIYANLFYAGPKTIQGVSIPATVCPSLRLVGVRVLKLERWGGSGAQAAEADEEAIKGVLGQDFAYDDLAAYAEGAVEEDHDGQDLTPEDQAKTLFGGE